MTHNVAAPLLLMICRLHYATSLMMIISFSFFHIDAALIISPPCYAFIMPFAAMPLPRAADAADAFAMPCCRDFATRCFSRFDAAAALFARLLRYAFDYAFFFFATLILFSISLIRRYDAM